MDLSQLIYSQGATESEDPGVWVSDGPHCGEKVCREFEGQVHFGVVSLYMAPGDQPDEPALWKVSSTGTDRFASP